MGDTVRVVQLRCPGCGASVEVSPDGTRARCPYCDTTLLVDDEALHVVLDDMEQVGYEFERGRQRAQRELAPRRRRTWLWVLGWIFCFPIPLTVLILRNERMSRGQRLILAIVLWLFLFVLSWVNRHTWPQTPRSSDTGTAVQQVVASSEEEAYVIRCLSNVEYVRDPTPVTAQNDPNGGLGELHGYIAAIYFSCDLVDRDTRGDDVVQNGTAGGGCVEVFEYEEEARRRDEYLGTANDFLGLAGSHTVHGVYVIRTSDLLTKGQQMRLEAKIIEALDAGR